MSQEKTEKPTPKRRKENRKEGQVPRTQELGAWSALLLVGMVLPSLLGRELEALRELMSMARSLRHDNEFDLTRLRGLLKVTSS